MKINLLTIILSVIILTGCEKQASCPVDLQIISTNLTPTIGENFTIKVVRVNENDLFSWSGPGNFSGNYGSSINIDNPGYLSRGWYHCSKSNPDCDETLYDSIFIDVKLRQGNAPCTVANNSITGNSLPVTNFYSVIKNFDPTFNGVALYGSSTTGYPTDFRVLFNSNNGNIEPLDGVYTTKNDIIFSQTDDYILVSLSFIYNSQFFHCHSGQPVFIKHINGKLSASFCDVPFSDGTYTLNVSGTITEQ